MFEFLRENLLCSSDDSPKRELNSRRRPGEVISSQGNPVHPLQQRETASAPALPYERQRARRNNSRSNYGRARRTPSPLPHRWSSSRSPCSSFRTAPSFREALGGSLAYTGAAAAQQEELLPGRGLYVPFQRGLEPRGVSRPPPALRARSPAAPEEEEGRPRNGSFIHRAADTSLALGVGSSFEHREVTRQGSAAAGAWGGGGGSFLLGSEPCGLLPGRDGSFYAVPGRGDPRLEAMRAAGTPPPPAAQTTPLPPAPAPGQMLCSAPPSVYVATQQGLAQQRTGMCTPTMPASRVAPMVQRQATAQAVLGCATCFAPAFVAVHG
mmetsp:Transcript_102780/g.299784  ORF Transcript_102780/g.299784 Transcript_102780/m.299784 type:complete len:324 (-) Transcript_102780:169-1140(-)